MENLHTKQIRRWVCLLAIFVGFSIQTGLSTALISACEVSPTSPKGMDPVIFSFGCIDGEPGDTICIPVTVENFNAIVIAQFEIYWNSSVLDYIEISNPGTPRINVIADFNLSGPNALKFIPLGFPIDGETLPDGTVLFEICFRIIGFPDSTSCVGISPYFDFEVADVSGVIPSDSVNCCMTVDNAVTLVAFVSSCGPSVAGGNGTIDVTAYGGTAPYTITGVPGGPYVIPTEGGSTILNAPAGTYNVVVTDGLGNSVMYSTDIAVIELGVITRPRDPTCYKFENGTIRIIPTGGSEPYSYIWQSLIDPNLAGSGFIRNLGDSSLITSLPDGLYQIHVEDNNGCSVEVTVTLNDNPFIVDIPAFNDASCIGAENGTIEISISGATPIGSAYTISGNLTGTPFQISSNTITLGLLDPGNYEITISDNVSQCDTVFEFTIGYSDTISSTITVTDPPCAGDVNGSISIHGLTNGIPGPLYSYTIFENGVQVTSIDDIGGTFNYSPLSPGNYTVVVEEGECLSDSIQFTISEPPPITIAIDGLTPDNCVDVQRTGDIWFTITGGVGPYTLDVGQGFQDGDTIFNIGTGNHILTVEDAIGCTATLPFYMPDFAENEEADISFQIDGTPCDGGTLTVLYQGGPLPPNAGVSWSNTDSITATILITDTDTISVEIFLNAPIFCILNDTVHIKCDEELELDITVIQPLCGEGAEGGPYTGTVIVDTSNAVAPVTWIWSFPDTTTTGLYSGLAPGKYYVTVTDGLDSTAVDSFEIVAPNTLTLTFSNIDSTSCPEICDGAVRIVPGNGDPTLDYQIYWDPINPMADTGVFFNINGLCAGLNVFALSQDGLCFYNDTIEILAPDSIEIDLIQSIDATCYGYSDGLLEVVASGGTPSYTYAWLNGPALPLNNGIASGMQFITVTDSKNCSITDSFSIAQPDTLIATIDSSGTLNLSCGNSSDGIISLDVTGGNAGSYSFTWNPDVSTSAQAANLGPGSYFITVTDLRGCTDTTSFILTSPPPIAVTWPLIPEPACFGDEIVLLIEDGDVSGGNGNYSYSVNSGELLDLGEPLMLPSGIYNISVFDDRGCSTDTTYIIMEPSPILVSIGPENPVIDLGDSIFIIGNVDQSDNLIVMTFWSSVEPVSCVSCEGTYVFNSVPTVYTWTVTDEKGCQGSASILVDVDYERDVYIPNIFSPNGDGRNDEFKIFTGLGVVSINYINIYDRWGNLVHVEPQQLPSPTGTGNWDGSFNGKYLNPGVYVYVAEITFVDNNTTLTYSGDVTLVK